MSDRLLPWVLRAAWAVVPVTAGGLLATTLDPWPAGGATGLGAAAWAVWALVTLATFVAHPVALTVVRSLAPATVVVVALAARDASAADAAVALIGPVAATAVAALPAVGAHFVNGPSYPNERRLPLRVPGPVLLGPLPLTWAATVGLPLVAALMLAAERWTAGGIAAAAAVPTAVLGGRALHGLARRWVVFVPAGVVLHDPLTLVDPVLFRREVVETLRPAPADSDSLDLTMNAPGLALELLLTEKVPMVLSRPGRDAEAGSSARLLFTPTRPGVVLTEAAARRLTVG